MKLLIAGLAKTGTTGLLYFAANSIGNAPKLLFEPTSCPPNVRNMEGDVIAKILIGGKLDAMSFAFFNKKITLVRDPRDRLISALLYSQYHADYLHDEARVSMVRQILEAKESNPSSVSLREIIETLGRMAGKSNAHESHLRQARVALDWFESYMASMPDALPYKYEDFVSGNYQALERYLGTSMLGAADVPDRLARVRRTKGYGDWRHWFTEEDVRDLRPIFSAWLDKHGYDGNDWTLDARQSILPEHCSRYYLRLVNEQRAMKSRKAKILRAEPGIVVGWAIGNDPALPVRVALMVNGNEVAQEMADRPRPRLKERGVHPTGSCGFVFRFGLGNKLHVGDRVSIKGVDPKILFDDVSAEVAAPRDISA